MSTPLWEATAFAATPGDVPITLVPDWIKRLVIQVAWGSGPPPQPISDEWLAQARDRFEIYGWAWCAGVDVEAEATYHGDAAERYGCTGFVANMEEPYDAHGDSHDPCYTWPEWYLEALDWREGPLGVTTTATFGSDLTAWVGAGATVQPQAFTLEVPVATLTRCVEHARAWGWPLEQIRPLLQAYPTNGQRPDPVALNAEAAQLGVGGIAYTIEQAMDEPGRAWLEAVRPTLERPQTSSPTPGPEPEPPAPTELELIGSQHGITAYCDWLRQQPNVPQRGAGYDPANRSTWPWVDKLERTLTILATDHDAWAQT